MVLKVGQREQERPLRILPGRQDHAEERENGDIDEAVEPGRRLEPLGRDVDQGRGEEGDQRRERGLLEEEDLHDLGEESQVDDGRSQEIQQDQAVGGRAEEPRRGPCG